MNQIRKKNISPSHQKRLENIALMFKEIRFSEGKKQSDFATEGVSRRQIQYIEQGRNISLVRMFTILDLYGYKLSDFEDIL